MARGADSWRFFPWLITCSSAWRLPCWGSWGSLLGRITGVSVGVVDVEWWHFAIALPWAVLLRLRMRRAVKAGQVTGAERSMLSRGGF